MNQDFNLWWDTPYTPINNPFTPETPAWWSWEAWQAATKVERKWVGLTDEEVEQIVNENTHNAEGYQFWCSGKGVAEGVEAKLRERNT